MKIEHLIARYLFTHKKLSLQDIGTFYISADTVIPTEDDKEFVLPENAIQFDYDPKARQDDDFIQFIVEQTRKIKPLATSDLESFTMLGRQFINIGKPLVLEGVGIILKNQAGQYVFEQGASLHTKIETQPTLVREKEKAEIDFSAPPRKKGSQKWIGAVIILAIATTLALVFFSLREKKLQKSDQPVVIQPDTTIEKKDTIIAMQPVQDSISLKPATDSSGFSIVIREYTTALTAEKTLEKFGTYGHKLTQIAADTNRYLLAMPFKKPLQDTSRMKDSLKILFGGKPSVWINQ